jgi:ribosomal protein S18 acetylase RimI-like enzyme
VTFAESGGALDPQLTAGCSPIPAALCDTHPVPDWQTHIVSEDGRELLRQMQEWARSTWNPARRWTPGEMAWSTLTAPVEPDVILHDGAMAWKHDDLVAILAAEEKSRGQAIEWAQGADIEVCVGDEHLEAAVRVGYEEARGCPFSMTVHRSTAGASELALPRGYRLRAATNDDDLVGVHRASWKPSALPFAEGHRPHFSSQAESNFTEETLGKVQSEWPYRLDLHVVAEEASGALVASCIVWLDDETGVASIEPLGVDPLHRRRGLGEALNRFAVEEVRRAGGTDVVVHPRGDTACPAALATYLKAGFTCTGRTRTFTR